MTEGEWLTRAEPRAMLDFLQGRASPRKLRLFACAGWQRAWSSHPGWEVQWRPRWHDALAYADGLPRERYLEALGPVWEPWFLADAVAENCALFCVNHSLGSSPGCTPVGPAYTAGLLREIFGNPFRRPADLPAAWLACNDGVLAALARAIYEEMSFERLPVLGDALEEAGCTDEAILAHCRSGTDHVRGCWVLDWILGQQ
jgi:hypothetical protein